MCTYQRFLSHYSFSDINNPHRRSYRSELLAKLNPCVVCAGFCITSITSRALKKIFCFSVADFFSPCLVFSLLLTSFVWPIGRYSITH